MGRLIICDIKKYGFALIVSLCFQVGCQSPNKEKLHFVGEWKNSFEDDGIYNPARIKGNAVDGSFFSRTNKDNIYSDCFQFLIPDSLLGKNLRLYINGFVRKGDCFTKAFLVTTLQEKNAEFWRKAFEIEDLDLKKDEWFHFSDSTQVPASKNNRSGALLKVYGWNGAGICDYDLDDMKLVIKRVEFIKSGDK